jgi:hypothetical protein
MMNLGVKGEVKKGTPLALFTLERVGEDIDLMVTTGGSTYVVLTILAADGSFEFRANMDKYPNLVSAGFSFDSKGRIFTK